MKKIKKSLSITMLWLFWVINLFPSFNLVLAQNPYNNIMGATTDDQSLYSAIHGDGEVIDWENEKWAKMFNKQVVQIISYVIDFFIVIWIAVAFIWGYKIMTSDKEETMKEGIRLVIFGIIWIIIMVSARFIANWFVDMTDEQFNNPLNQQPSWIEFADDLYNKIMYPFIKIALYFVIWILFFIMVGKVINFVTATDDSAKKKAAWIIIRCVVWILIVMWSKQIVEAVMWKQSEVLNKNAQRINWWSWMWDEILEFGSIPLIAQIINWVMGLTMFAIVVLIIIQWYKIFTKPDDPKTRESLKKTILYIVIWVLVIWAAYVISSALVLNNIQIYATAT